jgi:repressor LexA
MKDLTKRQREILEFLTRYKSNNGLSPTMREISEHLGSISLNAVFNHLAALEGKGAIRRDRNKARSIFLNQPESIQTR